eukprot:Sspe_Gene.54916::Locus_30255_Transcript_1_1_Confidence_1.000_Length_4369::g.54916::m.54916
MERREETWRSGDATSILDDDSDTDDLMKEIDDQMVRQQRLVQSTICEGQAFLDRIHEVAQEIHNAQPYEITTKMLREWATSIKESATDCRRKLLELQVPAIARLPRQALASSLRTAKELSAAQKQQQAILHKVMSVDPPEDHLPQLHPGSSGTVRRGRDGTVNNKPSLSKAFRQHFSPTIMTPCPPLTSPETSSLAPPNIRRARQQSTARPPTKDPLDPAALPNSTTSLVSLAVTVPGSTLLSPSTPIPPSTLHTRRAKSTIQAPQSEEKHSCEQLLTAGLYLISESILYSVKAERVVILRYVPSRDELQAVSCAGQGLPLPHQIRIPPHSGVLGSVFSANVAMNVMDGHVTHEAVGFKTTDVTSLLAAPIPQPSNGTTSCGVILLMNKYRGMAPFTAQDEAMVHSSAILVAHLLNRYPCDFTKSFDPSPFHAVVPLKPPELPVKDISDDKVSQHHGQMLVYRTPNMGKYVRKNVLQSQSTPVQAATGLQDILGFMNTLEACWEESIVSLMQMEANVASYMEQARVMREQVRKKSRKIGMLKELARKHAEENIKLTAEIKIMKESGYRRESNRVYLDHAFSSNSLTSVGKAR